MTQIHRRRLLQLSGAGAAAAATGGLAGILASGRAPAYAQDRTLHWVRWSDFVPTSDALLKGKMTDECAKALGFKLQLETINANDIQARVTSAIQSGSGPDIIMGLNNWPQLYTTSLADVTEVAGKIADDQGGYYPISKQVATVAITWIGVPWASVAGSSSTACHGSRRSAMISFPGTWDKLQDAGKKLKAKGRPIGQALAHSFGDPPGFFYPWLWSFGGKEVETDGKTVALNSKETLESVKALVPFWNDACDPGGLAWDDSSNNRAFLSGTISATNNGASIYIEGKRKPDSYQTDSGEPMYKDMMHAPLPKGPGGQYNLPGPFTDMVMGYSKNQDIAKKFLAWVHSKACSRSGSPRSRATPTARPSSGKATRCGAPTRCWRRSRCPANRSAHRLCRPAKPCRRRGADQVHHRRYVREGSPGHEGRGCRSGRPTS